ncbi:hypothetical protein TPENAI_70454 [Tenacibaculum litopenaei]|uniref:hypothetical protein n=1 Tax=Tenacibaculum litopenaei TaxID=396016 RepID=UPI0038931C1E
MKIKLWKNQNGISRPILTTLVVCSMFSFKPKDSTCITEYDKTTNPLITKKTQKTSKTLLVTFAPGTSMQSIYTLLRETNNKFHFNASIIDDCATTATTFLIRFNNSLVGNNGALPSTILDPDQSDPTEQRTSTRSATFRTALLELGNGIIINIIEQDRCNKPINGSFQINTNQ